MVICEDLLFSHGAQITEYNAGDYIFQEGTSAKFYFQIKGGTVKLNTFTEEGKEFVHGLPFDGHCIGESYLFTEHNYAVNAIAVSDCKIIKLPKSKFLPVLLEKPALLLKLSNYTADRLHFRYMISSFLAISDPTVKLKKLFDHLKNYFGFEETYSFLIPYTRQQIATLTGLRVETVIRYVKKMEEQKLVKLDSTKIYY
ncbi:Crp/Fnr family transcriptional regulator [Chryseobacterium indologenes]|uniref:Crp/Fnr family transcriptional regulator n=1 Tax=Chryseobacterium indologenes TaxID=253 RepID=A0AAD0YTR8_CHRID|nr:MULTISPECIES: Crp/Fnr family transcriptional regulator [Chryseobacterium]ASE61525.1 Crp/Fnr family transcriptional regulator [Chryseobacterium indologenes]ATN05610.1 Crp/Fnr family transcriptional regulator [Chryseobacterium indologenes]AYY85631.1 Crp/Fnr family transcriptional regulator [Chryseobacterium indologenes]AYZ35398.1 Crp/Fnr family transcriptional regulator [Chryseobacterium indologenes]AZB17195.1 Crp/Fnr family transcriptional regulator [Chryseobacterium indologenes]